MTVLLLKLFLTPTLIAAVTIAGRRWGPGVSGWLVGFPLTSAPVSLILAMQHGPAFGARAAIGTLGGQACVAIFCFTYSVLAARWDWPASAITAIVVFLVGTAVWNHFTLALLPTFAVVLIFIGLVNRGIPQLGDAGAPAAMPRWDIPARMTIAGTFVMALTALSSTLGPQLSGLLSPFPIFAVVLATFAHRHQGAAAANRLLRGVVLGSFGFVSFFAVVGATLPAVSIPATYALATLAALLINGVSYRLAR